MENNTITTVKSIIKSIKTIHRILYLGLIGFAIASIFLRKLIAININLDENAHYIIKFFSIFSMLIIIPFGHFIFKKMIKKIDTNIDIIKRIKLYKTAFIIKMVLYENVSVLCIIMFLLVGDLNILTMSSLGLIAMLIYSPTLSKISDDIYLTIKEVEELL